ncbi:MAG: hypothetical protein AAFW83_08485 [Pseudomonadota bacterium]
MNKLVTTRAFGATIIALSAVACATTTDRAADEVADNVATQATDANVPVETVVDASAITENESNTKTATNTDEEVDENRIICKRQQVTGSRFAKKICRTWAEWKQSADVGREFAEQSSRRGGLISPASN